MPAPPIAHSHRHRRHHPYPQQKSTFKLLLLFLKTIIIIFLLSLFFIFLAIKIFIVFLIFFLRSIMHHLHLHLQNRNILPHFHVIDETETDDTQCVVCLEGFQNGEWCRKLITCGHVFHRRCVDMWLVNVAVCPICRTPVPLNAWARGSLASVVNEEDRQLWIHIINDITAYMACELFFGPWFNAWSTEAVISRSQM